jgi:hypothetical protein
MKEIKIMLLSFTLLTVLGGALAFKVKYGPLAFCYTTTTITVLPKCSITDNLREEDNGTRFTYYTTSAVYLEGVGDQCCFEGDGISPLTCVTKIEVTKD